MTFSPAREKDKIKRMKMRHTQHPSKNEQFLFSSILIASCAFACLKGKIKLHQTHALSKFHGERPCSTSHTICQLCCADKVLNIQKSSTK